MFLVFLHYIYPVGPSAKTHNYIFRSFHCIFFLAARLSLMSWFTVLSLSLILSYHFSRLVLRRCQSVSVGSFAVNSIQLLTLKINHVPPCLASVFPSKTSFPVSLLLWTCHRHFTQSCPDHFAADWRCFSWVFQNLAICFLLSSVFHNSYQQPHVHCLF